MNAMDIVFSSVSNLTGGLINDVTTLVVGLVAVAFICMAADLLIGPMLRTMKHNADYQDYKRKRLNADIYKRRYEKEGNFTGGWDDNGKFKVNK